jgi:hypothetical protein
MVTIPLKTRLRPDGTLDVHVPTGLPESDVDVLVVVQPSPARDRWPAGFIEETYGTFADAPLTPPSQPASEIRDPLL